MFQGISRITYLIEKYTQLLVKQCFTQYNEHFM